MSRARRRSALLAIAAAAATVLVGCGGDHVSAKKAGPSGQIRFSITGVAPTGVDRVQYIAQPDGWQGLPNATVLTRHAHLPYSVTVKVDPTKTNYYFSTELLSIGHITCTAQIGGTTNTGEETEYSTAGTSGCDGRALIAAW